MGEVAEKIGEDIEIEKGEDIEIEKGEDISEKVTMENKLMVDFFLLLNWENIINNQAELWIENFAAKFNDIWEKGERDIDRIKNELYGDLNK